MQKALDKARELLSLIEQPTLELKVEEGVSWRGFGECVVCFEGRGEQEAGTEAGETEDTGETGTSQL